MSKIQTIAAIDIGTTKIVAIVGTKDDEGNVNVLGFGEAPSKGVSRGSVQNVGEVSNAIRQAVRRCQESSGSIFKQVFVGIAGQNIKTTETSHTKVINNRVISQADVDELTAEVYKLTKENGEEIIHVIPQSYTVDNTSVKLNPVGCSGRSLTGTFYVVIGSADAVSKIKQAIEMSGLKILKIVLQSIAAGDAILTNDDKEVGTLVVDMGSGTTDVSLYYENALRDITVIPFGGNAITEDIKQGCQILWRQAESLKTQYAAALPDAGSDKSLITISNGTRADKEVSLADLAAITNARVEEIVAGIAHVLNETRYGDIISQIAITGGGSRLKNLTALMKYRLGREVAVAKPRGISAESCPKLFNVEYSTVVGLLVKGIEYMEKYNQRQIPEEVVTPEGGTLDGGNKPGPGGNVKPDPKPKPKPEKKSSRFMTWVNNTLKSMFGEDGTESKI